MLSGVQEGDGEHAELRLVIAEASRRSLHTHKELHVIHVHV